MCGVQSRENVVLGIRPGSGCVGAWPGGGCTGSRATLQLCWGQDRVITLRYPGLIFRIPMRICRPEILTFAADLFKNAPLSVVVQGVMDRHISLAVQGVVDRHIRPAVQGIVDQPLVRPCREWWTSH